MARITVEDCLQHVENRFALVYTTSKRTQQLIHGVTPLYPCDNKEIVTALREIAAMKVVVVPAEEKKSKKN